MHDLGQIPFFTRAFRYPPYATYEPLVGVRLQTINAIFFEGTVAKSRLDAALAYLRRYSQAGYPLDPRQPAVTLYLFSPPGSRAALWSESLPANVMREAGGVAARILRGEPATSIEVARPAPRVVVFEWLGGQRTLGQVAQCCERLAATYPNLYDTTLNATEQTLVADFAARSGSLTSQEEGQFAEFQKRCCDAIATTTTPPPGANPTLVLQRQINQVLAPHGCRIDEDGALGGETCGAIALINERNWGNVQAPARCASINAVPPTGCAEAPAAGVAKRRGGGGGVVLLAVAALAAIGAVLVGRGGG